MTPGAPDASADAAADPDGAAADAAADDAADAPADGAPDASGPPYVQLLGVADAHAATTTVTTIAEDREREGAAIAHRHSLDLQ